MTIPDLNFGDLLDGVADAAGDQPAVVCGEQSLSWRQLDMRSNRLARYLAGHGLTPGSKVAFYLRNSPAYVELFCACAKGRFTHANVNYRYVGNELFHVLDNSDAEVVVFDSEFQPHIDTLRDRLPKVKLFLEVGGDANRFESACSHGDSSRLNIQRSGDDLYFMYTGGTTGYPKAVMWPHKERIAAIGITDAQSVDEHVGNVAAGSERSISLPAAPLMHSTGFSTMIATLLNGGCVVLLPDARFSGVSCLQEIERHQVQRLAIVGDAFSYPLLEALRENDSYELQSVKAITSAGAMWSENCKRELLMYFREAALADSLGSSEGSRLGASTMRLNEPVKTAKFSPGPGVRVLTEDFRDVVPGSGEAGMIAKSGPLPLGYYKDEERTKETFPIIDGVRYSMAGDWCRIEKDGSMTLLGRGNNCINTGGEKVYPEEVEEAAKLHPAILDIAVIGTQDDRFGQSVTALLRTVDGRMITKEELKKHLADHIAGYKHPRYVLHVNDDFRHANGKINYRLAHQLVAEARAK